MKTIKVFETEDELIRGFTQARKHDDDFPVIPFSVSLAQDMDGTLKFKGEDNENFQISPFITYFNLVDRVLEIQGIRFEIEKAKDVQADEQK